MQILLALLLAQIAGTPGQIQTPNAGRWTSQQGTYQAPGANSAIQTIEAKFRTMLAASDYTGVDMCAQIANAIAQLPSTGGYVDASMFSGTQACASNPFAAAAVPVNLRLPGVNINVATSWAISTPGVTIAGQARDGALGAGTILKWVGASAGGPIVKFVSSNGNYGTVTDASFDGNALADVCLQFEVLPAQSLKHPHMERLEFYNYRRIGLVAGYDSLVTLSNGAFEQAIGMDLTFRGGSLSTAYGMLHNAQNDEHFNCFNCYFDPWAGTYQNHAYAIYNKAGTMNIFGLSTTRSNTASIFANDTVNIYNWRSEDNFLLDTAASQFGAPMLMESVYHNNFPSPSVANVGTPGGATYAYQIVCKNASTVIATSVQGVTATGNATLNGSNYNTVTWAAPPVGTCTSYDVYRTQTTGTPSTFGKIANTASLTYNDQGAAGDLTGTAAADAMRLNMINTPTSISTAVLTGNIVMGASDARVLGLFNVYFIAGSMSYSAPQNQVLFHVDPFNGQLVMKGGFQGGVPTIRMQDQANSSGAFSWNGTTFAFNKPVNVTSTVGAGTITLAAGTGTATTFSGARCVCTDTTANVSVKCAVATTTLTATGTGTDVIAYHCF